MQTFTENLGILIFAGMGGMFILAVSFILLHIHGQNRFLKQKDHEQKLQLDHQQELLQTMIRSQEFERKRIGQDLHDDVGTALSNLRITLNLFEAETRIKLALPQAKELSLTEPIDHQETINAGLLQKEGINRIEHISTRCKIIIDKVIQDVRHISHNLSPPGIELYGFLGALEELCDSVTDLRSLQININNQAGLVLDALDQTQSISLYRIMEELISNTLKHAGATTIDISFLVEDALVVEYRDNGVGVKPLAMSKKGMGLHNIESRLKVINGMLIPSISSVDGYECKFKLMQ